MRLVSIFAWIVAFLLFCYAMVLFFNMQFASHPEANICSESCRVEYVESIPTGLNFTGGPIHRPTHQAWQDLFNTANKSIHIAALYWNLNSSEYPTAEYGRQVFSDLVDAGRRGVDIRIAQDVSKGLSDNHDSQWLADQGLAKVRTLDFKKLMGSGVLHTKFIIVDLTHVYIGSANMDWKSLAEVKELGLYIQDCPCLAADLNRIFAVYWHLGQKDAKIPHQWPSSFETSYNIKSPMKFNWSTVGQMFSYPVRRHHSIQVGREHDLETIITLISSAHRSVCVAVMDLIPQTLYMGTTGPISMMHFRSAAFRGVDVKLLVSQWKSLSSCRAGLSQKPSRHQRWAPEDITGQRKYHSETIHCTVDGGATKNTVCTCKSQQVHGHRSGSVCW
ncbi:phospholipase D domain protein [Cooperia oncophora]